MDEFDKLIAEYVETRIKKTEAIDRQNFSDACDIRGYEKEIIKKIYEIKNLESEYSTTSDHDAFISSYFIDEFDIDIRTSRTSHSETLRVLLRNSKIKKLGL